jgi:hypothetical protein
VNGIALSEFDISAEWHAIAQKFREKDWYRAVEVSRFQQDTLFSTPRQIPVVLPPSIVRAMEIDATHLSLQSLEDARIQIGQGLRTGCNVFFYVDVHSETVDADPTTVTASATFDNHQISVPAAALKPVLRKQSELKTVSLGQRPNGRLLDLRRWLLPEDSNGRETAANWGVMPPNLAEHVRIAGRTAIPGGTVISNLSAVRTNARTPDVGLRRYWYMLPDFAPRHLPQAFVPRVISGEPRTERNFSDPIIIDANFSTIWSLDGQWSGGALKALFNSIWCIAYMESLGTPLGGGALKLEAAHLRQLRIPVFTAEQRAKLAELGEGFGPLDQATRQKIDHLVLGALLPAADERTLSAHALALSRVAHELRRTRLRK